VTRNRARELGDDHLRPHGIGSNAHRFVDDFVFWCDLDTLVEKLHVHIEAGADRVAVQVIGTERGQSAMPN
jgi:hypothetical protein